MRQFLIITGLCLLLLASLWTVVFANTAEAYLRIGRLWFICEYDGAEGWSAELAWPGGYPIEAFTGAKELWDGNMRKTGTVAGCKDWTGPNDVLYPFWTSGMYRSYHYEYLPYWTAWTDLTQLFPVDQIEIQRWAPPRVVVNGNDVIPDAGDNYLTIHANAKIDPTLITERAVQSIWDYSMGVTYDRMTYAYSNRKHQDYILMDIKFTNTGRMNQSETVLSDQMIKDFWWSQTGNPWNSHSGRQFSFQANDEIGEFIQPFLQTNGDERRFYLFYDGDGPGSAEKDWGDPSKDSRWVRLLSPAWIAWGPLHADKSITDTADDPTQPRSTKIGHERWYDLSSKVKTMQEQYEALFTEDSHWPLNTSHLDVDPAIKEASGYTSFGPYTFAPGEDVNITLVWAAGGINMNECRRLGVAAKQANFTGPIMDEIEQLYKTGRDSVLQTLQRAWWNVKGSKTGNHKPFDVPDAPRPPAMFSAKSSGANILLEWSDESRNDPDFDTGVKDFAGYRVYRAVGARDSTYTLVYDGQANEYTDTAVTKGTQYFYYLVAYDNGTQNWEDPGVKLESGQFWCWTGWAPTGVMPTTQPITSASSLDDIRVVPNPYSAAGKTFPGEPNKIRFAGLPGVCTIKIYTCNGDYVTTLRHTDGSGDHYWDLRTEYNQYPASDVYIYTVDSDLGTHVGKFIIIR